jgi:hypothetical protein
MPTYPPAVVSCRLALQCTVASPHPEPPALLPPGATPTGFRRQLLGGDALAQHALLAESTPPRPLHRPVMRAHLAE